MTGWEILAVPFLLAGLGALLTDRSGPLNIALEGQMSLGAFTAAALILAGSTWPVALTGALVSGTAAALAQGVIRIKLKTDPFITGLGFNLLLPSLAALLSQAWYGTKGSLRWEPHPDQGMWLGILGVTALLLTVLVWYLLRFTPWGLRLRTAGSSETLLRARGINPETYRLGALAVSGALAALAGAHLALRLGAYLSGLTAGRGWIALVALYLGGRNPWGLLGAAILFAGAEAASQHLAGLHIIPESVILAMPHLLTLAALIGYSIFSRIRDKI